jgi:hypothetical protein
MNPRKIFAGPLAQVPCAPNCKWHDDAFRPEPYNCNYIRRDINTSDSRGRMMGETSK